MSFRIFLTLCLLLFTTSFVVAQERYRPLLHFTPPANWMNDPNGLVYFDGEYHLFYQHNPFGIRWGHMSWGHAVSQDLVKWEHLPIALPELEDFMAFSGSVVVDKTNSAGFGANALVALYTGYRPSNGHQAQYLAYSTDRGRTWERYTDKPVLDIGSTDFRDPKVFPYDGEWRMVGALPTQRKVSFYSSPDLKNWTWLSDFGPQGAVGGAWECPDLFSLPVENWEGQERWVLQVDLDRRSRAGGSGGQYFLGRFDGERFVVDAEPPSPLPPAGLTIAETWATEGQVEIADGVVRSDDSATGTATTPQFELSRPWLNFRLKGGRHPGKLGLRLLVEGEAVYETTGYNADDFDWLSWDVGRWQGKLARLEFFDETSALWGRLAVSDVQLSHQPAPDSIDRARWVDYGPDFYACVSFANTGDRKVWLAWMSNWLYAEDMPTDPWRSAMTAPRRVFLKRIGDSVRLCQEPVKELERYRTEVEEVRLDTVDATYPWSKLVWADTGDIVIEVERGKADKLEFELLALTYVVDFKNRTLTMKRGAGQTEFHPLFKTETTVPILLEDDRFEARLLYDQSSVELFTDQGAVSLTTRTFPQQKTRFNLSSEGRTGDVMVRSWGARYTQG